MPNTIYVKPFMQIVEDVMLEVREAAIDDETVVAKYKRRVNDVYTRIIPARHQYDHDAKEGSITLTAAYQVGTVAIDSGATSITGTDTTWTSAMTGRKIWIGSNPEVYTFTFSTPTTGTISPAFTGSSDVSGESYAIFVTDYELPADFDHFTTEPGMWYDFGRGRAEVQWYPEHLHMDRASVIPTSFPQYMRETNTLSSDNLAQVQIFPPVTQSRILRFEYYKIRPELVEFTSGTATTTANSTSVTTSADHSTNIVAGQYFRIDPSEAGGAAQWVKITAVSTTTLTVSPAYVVASTAGNYTVCDAPDYPPHFHMALFYGTCWLTAMEQNDLIGTQGFGAAFTTAMDLGIRKDSRKRYGRQRMRTHPRIGGFGVIR